MRVVSALELYKAMLRTDVAPVLRSHGFRGSGKTFSLPSETHWILIGFQGSMYNTRARVDFTVNWMVMRRDEWIEEWRKLERPEDPPKPIAADRIGFLMPGGVDRWWSIRGEAM